MTCVTQSQLVKHIGGKNLPYEKKSLETLSRALVLSSLIGLSCFAMSMVQTTAALAQSAVPAKPALQKQPASPAPKPAQSAPAAAQADAPNAAPPEGPIKVDLQPAAAEWTKVCGKDQGNNKQVCYTTRDFGQDANQPPLLAVAVYDIEGDDKRIVRFLLPIGLMLKPGFRMNVDQGQAIPGAYAICLPNGCFAETEVPANFIAQLKKTQLLSVAVRNQVNNEVTFTLPMKDFAKAFDGPPIDPEILKQQQQELQQKLEEQAKAQREQLEKQQPPGAQPLPGQLSPPVAPAPAPKP